MTVLAVALALLAALGNAAASVFQRRAVAQPNGPVGWFGWLTVVLRRPVWRLGAGLLAVSAVCQAAALAAGPLSVVQPVMTTELMFTLVVGSLVFRSRPDARTWWAFSAMAVGLAAFLWLTAPSGGRPTVPADRWPTVAVLVMVVIAVLIGVSLPLRPTSRTVLLGTATAMAFSCTAALMKDAIGRLPEGVDVFLASWQPYVAVGTGLVSFLFLQATLRAGTLVASQPALTLGDSLLSVVLGVVLFDESVVMGARLLPEAAALVLIVLGSVQLARSPMVSGEEDRRKW